MAIKYYLKRNNKTFNTQNDFKNRLNSIREKSYQSRKNVTDIEEINDLKDYLEDYHPDNERFHFGDDLEEISFFADKAPGYRTPCMYYKIGKEPPQQFSTTRFTPPTPKSNFKQFLSYILIDKKLQIKRGEMAKKALTGDLNEYILEHFRPSFDEIVSQFMNKKNISDNDLPNIISENSQGNNVPFLKDGFQHLGNEFLEFYENEYSRFEYKLSKK
ncbi:hypothetical protein [Avibacterium paragallinarum]|uniref:hypothetical protein n=1 Tax=Avibacterium paragallinarum TaxID=728 RepID=UPI003979B858